MTGTLRRGRRRFAVIGYALRVVGALPVSVQRALFRRAAAAGELPPMADLVRMLEAAGTMPEPGPSDAELFARFPELAEVEVSTPAIAGPDGTVPSRLYRRPGQDPQAALVWVHGGAFVSGTIDSAEAHWVGLALAARGIPVLSLDYRKALHGVRYPAASDDVLAGWTWAVDHVDLLGVPAERLHLGGASAGAALTAGVAKRLRDGAGTAPASVVLAYPLVHAELPEWDPAELAALREAAGGAVFTAEWIRDCTLHYVGDPAALADPYAFAANGDPAGLPPTLILNCELDSLRSSGDDFERRLAAAGVPVSLQQVPEARHGCLAEPFTAEGQDAIDRIARWLGGAR